MAFASRDQIRQAITAGRVQRWHFMKDGGVTNETPQAAGSWVSYYLAVGSPGAATAPTTYANCTDLAGSVFFTNVSPGNRYLTDVTVCATVPGTLMVYDRLGHIGDVVLDSTGNKTVTSSALPRSMGTNDLCNVEAWMEVSEATDTTAPVVSLNSYTNEAGTAARAGGTVTFPSATTGLGWMAKLPMQAGDKGIQAISTLNVATDSGSVGEVTVMLMRPLAYIPVATANVATRLELTQLPRVYDGSSICFAWLATSTTVVDFWGELTFAYDA